MDLFGSFPHLNLAPGTKTWLLTLKSISFSSPIPFTIVLWLLARNISFKHRKWITLVDFPILIWLLARKHSYLHLKGSSSAHPCPSPSYSGSWQEKSALCTKQGSFLVNFIIVLWLLA
jgi:hypothetical protein